VHLQSLHCRVYLREFLGLSPFLFFSPFPGSRGLVCLESWGLSQGKRCCVWLPGKALVWVNQGGILRVERDACLSEVSVHLLAWDTSSVS
jgi:hypothetical protein